MLNKLSVSLVVAILIAIINPSCLQAQAPALPPEVPVPASPPKPEFSSAVSHGYIVTITNPVWDQQWGQTAALLINFNIKHADGTPVTFVYPDDAVRVLAWTDTNFTALVPHTSVASFDKSSKQWNAQLSNLDSRDKVVHIEFEVRDPETKSTQTRTLKSTFRFENIPIPTKADTAEPLTSTFTTSWGTVVTMTGITLSSANNMNQPTDQFNLTVDYSKVPDDSIQLSLVKAYDNGVEVNNFGGGYNNSTINAAKNTKSITVNASGLDPGSHTALTFEFNLTENSFDTVKSIAWKSVQMDLPLKGLAVPKSNDTFTPLGQTSQSTIQYQIGSLKNPNNSRANYVVWTQTAVPAKYCHIINYMWTPGDKQNNGQGYTLLQSPPAVYLHTDGSPLSPGESGALLGRNGYGNIQFPLYLTTQLSVHDQQIITFSKIPNPTAGQSLVIDQKPDMPAHVPIKLRAIAFKPNPHGRRQQGAPATELRLVFEYNVADSSSVSLTTISARDDFDNSLNFSYDEPMMNFERNNNNVDPDLQTITINVAVPPTNSKTINLKLMLTKDTPIGSPVSFSIDSAGKWTPIDASQFPDGGNTNFGYGN